MNIFDFEAERLRLEKALKALVDSCTDVEPIPGKNRGKVKAPKRVIVNRCRTILKELSQ